jgi:hypothetical protein
MRRFLFVISFLLPVFPQPVGATVIVPLEFRELVAAAPVIVHGRVTDVRAEWMDGRRRVETIVTLHAVEYLKGPATDDLTFKVPGGQIGRYRTIMIGAPEFAQGDEVVLFLNAVGPNAYVYGLNMGVFRVVTDHLSGRRVVIPPAIMARLAGDVEVVIRGERSRQPLAVDAFKETIRQTMAARRGER